MDTKRNIITMLMCAVLSMAAHAQTSHWQCDVYAYEYDMAVYYALYHNGVVVTGHDNYEVAAFVGEECRGVGTLVTSDIAEGQTVTFGYLRVHSNNLLGETVTFKCYDKTKEVEYEVEDYSLSFKSQDVVGLPSNPVVLAIYDEFSVLATSSDETKGVVAGSTTIKYGDNVTVRATANEGYHFVNWTVDDNVVSTDASYTFTVEKDVVLVANFAPNQYTMTFVLDNGEENIVKVQDYGTEVTAPEDPTKEGYTFTGWNPTVPETMPAHDVTCTAQFTVNTYYVIYMVNGEEWARDPVEYGAPIVLREYPVEAGYTFSGWASDAEYETMPAHNVVYTAELTTGIASIPANVKSVNVYHLNGTLLYHNIPVERINELLPKGIYIIHGNKYIVK